MNEKEKNEFKMKMLKEHFEWASSEEEAKAMVTDKSVYFPGYDGFYLYRKLCVGGNTFKVIEKVPKCVICENIKQEVTDINIINKIPKNILTEIIGTFSYICDKSGNECAAQIYKNKSTGDYFIYYPEQKVSKGLVTYTDDPNIVTLRNENDLVFEFHSHDTMSAFWSGTDDANEKEPCFYSVMGNLDREELTYKCRIKVGDNVYDLKWNQLFDITEEEEKEIIKRKNREKGNPEIDKKVKENIRYSTKSYYNSCFNNDYNRMFTYRGSESYKENFKSDFMQDTSGQGTSMQDTSMQDTSMQGTSMQDTSGQDTLVQDTSGQDTSMQDTLVQDTSGQGTSVADPHMYPSTDEFICDLSIDYNSRSVGVSPNVTYIEANNLIDIHDNDAFEANEMFNNGYKMDLSDLDNNINKYMYNLDMRIKARVVQQYSTQVSLFEIEECEANSIEKIDNSDDFYGLIDNITSSEVVSADFDLPTVWETMNKYEKACVANAMNSSVTDIGKVVYYELKTNYYVVYLMYALSMANWSIRGRLLKAINFIINNKDMLEISNDFGNSGDTPFEVVINYIDKIVCLASEMAGESLEFHDILNEIEAHYDMVDNFVKDAEQQQVLFE